jgi:hypothetical protein
MAMANDLKGYFIINYTQKFKSINLINLGLLINLLESISLKINSPSYRISVAETLLKFGLKRPDVFIPTVRTYLSAMPNQVF